MIKQIILLVIIFLFIGGYIIKTAYDTDFSNKEDVKIFSKEFTKWFFRIGKNTASTTANVVKDVVNKTWLPEVNETE